MTKQIKHKRTSKKGKVFGAGSRNEKIPIKVPKLVKEKINIQYDAKGFMKSITNPFGRKENVYIYSGIKPGFSAKVEGGRELPGSRLDAEKYAKELSLKGHKKVTFRD